MLETCCTVPRAVHVAKPNPNTQGLADRYATRWYKAVARAHAR